MTIIDRLLRACATGVGCRALINTRVLDSIKPDLWPAIDALRDVRFGRNERFERASRLCANLSCIRCGALQLGLKVLDLNTEGFLKILGAQKLLPEVSVGCNLPLNVFLEGAYLLLIGAWKASHGPLDHIKVALRSGSHLFEIFKHHAPNGFERVFFGCHVTLPASHAIYRHRTVRSAPAQAERSLGSREGTFHQILRS